MTLRPTARLDTLRVQAHLLGLRAGASERTAAPAVGRRFFSCDQAVAIILLTLSLVPACSLQWGPCGVKDRKGTPGPKWPANLAMDCRGI